MRIIILYTLIIVLFAATTANGQFGRKATVSAFVGTMITGKDKINAAGISQNLFGGYKPGIVFGGNLFYNITKNFSVGARARYINVSRTNYKVNQFALGVDGKFNFLPSDKKFSPYVVGEISLSLNGVNQSSNTQVKNPSTNYGSPDGSSQDVPVTQIVYYYPSTTVSFIPMLGYAAGAGIDIRVKETLGAFVQVDYSSSFAKNQATIKKYFPDNTSNFSYILFSVGLKFNLFKSTSLY